MTDVSLLHINKTRIAKGLLIGSYGTLYSRRGDCCAVSCTGIKSCTLLFPFPPITAQALCEPSPHYYLDPLCNEQASLHRLAKHTECPRLQYTRPGDNALDCTSPPPPTKQPRKT